MLPVSLLAGAEAPGGFVAYYRLYLLSEPEGRFVGFEEIEAGDDVEAVRRAGSFIGDRPLELWCGKRRVKTFPAADGLAPATA